MGYYLFIIIIICLSILVNDCFQISFNLNVICKKKITLDTVTELF